MISNISQREDLGSVREIDLPPIDVTSAPRRRFTQRPATKAGRWALIACTLAAMAIPSLAYSIVAAAAVSVVSFALIVKWTLGRNLPRSLYIIQTGVGLFVIAIVVRVVETGLNNGELAFPGYADLFAFPAYLVVAVGVGMAVMSRHALAKTADVLDAAAVSVAVITTALALSSPYFTDQAVSQNARFAAIGYAAIELGFLAVIIVLVFGPSRTVKSTRWIFASGIYATMFDSALNIAYVFDHSAIADNLLRTLAFPIAAYAVATGLSDYSEFARPGVRNQRHRWFMYGVCFAALALLITYNNGAIEVFGLIAFGFLATARLGVGHTIAGRLTLLNTTQTDLATALAEADSPPAALRAGVDACHRLLASATNVTIRSDVLDTDFGTMDGSGAGTFTGVSTVISSHDNTLHITVAGHPRPHQWSAITQIATLLSFAVIAVDARAERFTAQTEANWRALSGADNELVFIVDETKVVMNATPNASAVLGTDPVGKILDELLDTDLTDIKSGTESEALIVGDDNRWMSVTAHPSDHASYAITVRDATARIRAEYVDPVTGLNNMAHLTRRGELAAATLITFRIDNFARINDSLGKAGADALLDTVAQRVQEVFRGGIDEAWRGVGPSFIVVCQGPEQSDEWIAARRNAISAPIHTADQTTHLTVSTIVVPVNEPTSVEIILHRADITVNNQKAALDGIYKFSPEIEKVAQRRYRIEEALAAMSDPGAAGFRPHYQPIIDAQDGTVARVEALLRWTHPTLGSISPAEFIPAAERTGHVAALDQFVLETACVDLRTFSAVSPELNMQVNLSPVGLTAQRLHDIANWVRANFDRPPRLTVEIIESAIGDEFDLLIPALSALRDAGIGISCDDFGVGESNMARLTTVPWTQVKLAGIFATELNHDTVARVIATIKSLGHCVVVENVEEIEQSDAMQAAGADYLQGWLISKDLPADKFTEFLAASQLRSHAD